MTEMETKICALCQKPIEGEAFLIDVDGIEGDETLCGKCHENLMNEISGAKGDDDDG
jgi:hypothetical protein